MGLRGLRAAVGRRYAGAFGRRNRMLRRTVRAFREDQLSDRAAALTYYGVLSLFPGLLVLVALLGVAGPSATAGVVDALRRIAPATARDTVTSTVDQLQANASAGSTLAVAGLLGALWTASSYVAAFGRAANAVYRIPEGRRARRLVLVRLGVTVSLMVLAGASALIVVFTGGIAHRAGSALGMGHTAVTAWEVAKWPVLAMLVTVMIALLYRTTPNVRVGGGRWITRGSLLALLVWLVASAGFSLYTSNFASYNKAYGTLAGVIVFLVWLWLGNLALLLGLEYDAELAEERAREEDGGGAGSAGRAAYAEPRDTRRWSEAERRRARGTGPPPDDGRSHRSSGTVRTSWHRPPPAGYLGAAEAAHGRRHGRQRCRERQVRGVSTVYQDRQATTDESVGVLVSRASEQISQLVRQELHLAQAEMRQKGKRFGVGGGLFSGAGLMGFLALEALVVAAIAAVAVALPVWASSLVVTGALLLIAGALAIAGKVEFRRATPAAPRQTIDSVKTDVAELREAVRR